MGNGDNFGFIGDVSHDHRGEVVLRVSDIILSPYPATWNPTVIQGYTRVQNLLEQGINPYGATKYDRTHHIGDLRSQCEAIGEGGALPTEVRIAGRLVLKREQGRISFGHIEDESGRVQIFMQSDEVGEEAYGLFRKQIITGDFLGLQGRMFHTRTGELTLRIEDYTLLASAIRPLPGKTSEEGTHMGLDDPELQQRQRYMHLASNASVRARFRARSQVVREMRQFLWGHEFMEVETPILQEMHGGAAARPFVTTSHALGMDLTLRIATELDLKRLIAGGYERVFEIGRIFRNEGIDKKHNPEFTSMELYWAYTDYEQMMWITETMVAHIVREVCGKHQIDYQGTLLNFAPPWRRVTMEAAIEQMGGVSVMGASVDSLRAIAEERGIELEDNMQRGWIIATLFEELAESQLVQPTFVTRYPTVTTPLAKRCPEDPEYVERFEAFVAGGMEIANAFSELNNPIDQRLRFEEQVVRAGQGDEEAHPFDENFVQALEIGMPPTGGLGIGIDRLAMVVTNSASIRDIILFPTMKPKLNMGLTKDKFEGGAKKDTF
ncbi:MAG: lysine--tRNA ligase [Candidatus Margulisbacteria bacterium]|nr:lysine--tRNA ligase [Candidatus Margulisiibacteriota bacterium]MBU1021276.1 lysine--tRNA ligase [Candidatus Margulisiibacteriota bacterium]MBU1729235.1 lysine--tRNA ligase [Candidatus Margulisiibacteriota bacterium]MBU1954908.1 lysine--tRNA ligase [Candidatus Margulisiibacteriota bacterium]